MLAAVSAILLAQTLQASYLPELGIKVTHYGWFEPVVPEESLTSYRKDAFGMTTLAEWKLNRGPHTFTVQKMTYVDPSKPKMSVRQVAESFHDTMFKLAKSLDEASGDTQMMDRHVKKFVDRKVEEVKIASLSAFLDSHRDLLTGSFRNYLAWGDDRSQVFAEIIGRDDNLSRKLISDTIKLITPIKLSPAEAGKLPLQTQQLTVMGISMQSPAVFHLFQRPAAASNRTGGKGMTAHARVADGFEVTVLSDTYTDAKPSNTEETVRKLKVTEELAGFEPVSAQIAPFAAGSMKGHVIRQRYIEFGTAMYGASCALATPTRSIIVHIHISETAGGKPAAERMLSSLTIAKP